MIWPRISINVTHIHNQEDLQRFICDEVQSKPIDMVNNLPYKIWLIADYMPGVSVILMMGHHSVTDGV